MMEGLGLVHFLHRAHASVQVEVGAGLFPDHKIGPLCMHHPHWSIHLMSPPHTLILCIHANYTAIQPSDRGSLQIQLRTSVHNDTCAIVITKLYGNFLNVSNWITGRCNFGGFLHRIEAVWSVEARPYVVRKGVLPPPENFAWFVHFVCCWLNH